MSTHCGHAKLLSVIYFTLYLNIGFQCWTGAIWSSYHYLCNWRTCAGHKSSGYINTYMHKFQQTAACHSKVGIYINITLKTLTSGQMQICTSWWAMKENHKYGWVFSIIFSQEYMQPMKILFRWDRLLLLSLQFGLALNWSKFNKYIYKSGFSILKLLYQVCHCHYYKI